MGRSAVGIPRMKMRDRSDVMRVEVMTGMIKSPPVREFPNVMLITDHPYLQAGATTTRSSSTPRSSSSGFRAPSGCCAVVDGVVGTVSFAYEFESAVRG